MSSAFGNTEEPQIDAVVVGGGFAGLYMVYQLRERGLTVAGIERGSDVGGTWFWNRYPGARCDVESVDYSYSFSEELEQEWKWSERYATAPEILSYIHHVADRFDLRKHYSLNTTVESATYDEGASLWSVRTDAGETLLARYCIMATGCLSVPSTPDLSGVDDFTGDILHTGDWPTEPVDFTGSEVAVIGTGSSGTQLIPLLAQQAKKLTVFLRTPNFCVPANNAPLSEEYVRGVKATYPERRAFTRSTATGLSRDMNRVSALEVSDDERRATYEENWKTAGFGFILSFKDLLSSPEANATAVRFLNSKARELIHDPAVADKLTATNYPFGSKRPCVDSGFFQTFNRRNVDLVDVKEEPIQRLTSQGIQTSAQEYGFDRIVFATGFEAMTGALNAIEITGRDGVTLKDRWAEGPVTYLGLAVSRFPNFFLITGPGSPSVLSNVLVSIEQHVEFIDELIGHAESTGVGTVEAEADAEEAWTEHVQDLAYSTLYPHGNSWYLAPQKPTGRRRIFMPYTGGLRAYRRKCAKVAADGYTGFMLESRMPEQQAV